MVALAEQSGRWEHSTNAFRQSAEDTDTVAMTLAHIKGGMKLVRNECPRITTCKVVNQMAEEAVISEPVSVRWFPVPRENTGKFADFGLEIAKAPRLSEENSIAYQ